MGLVFSSATRCSLLENAQWLKLNPIQVLLTPYYIKHYEWINQNTLITWKALNFPSPTYLLDSLTLSQPKHLPRSTSHLNSSRMGDTTFSVTAPGLENELSTYIRLSQFLKQSLVFAPFSLAKKKACQLILSLLSVLLIC